MDGDVSDLFAATKTTITLTKQPAEVTTATNRQSVVWSVRLSSCCANQLKGIVILAGQSWQLKYLQSSLLWDDKSKPKSGNRPTNQPTNETNLQQQIQKNEVWKTISKNYTLK